MDLLPQLPLWVELLIFVANAATIWVAGIPLSNYTVILADRLHLGQGLGMLILLAAATNLLEIAITDSVATRRLKPTDACRSQQVMAFSWHLLPPPHKFRPPLHI